MRVGCSTRWSRTRSARPITVKIICRGIAKNVDPKDRQIEIQASGGFTTITGRHISGTPTTVEDRTSELAALMAGRPSPRYVSRILTRHWLPNGPHTEQHNSARDVGGYLGRRGFVPDEVEQIVHQAATDAKDDESQDRARAAADSVKKLLAGTQEVTGGPQLAQKLGAACLEELDGYLTRFERGTADGEKDRLKQHERLRREVRRELDAEERGPIPTLVAVSGHDLSKYTFPLRDPLIERDGTVILRARHLAEIFAERGVGKTWLFLTLGLLLSASGTALGLAVRTRHRVLHVDGEMASDDLRDRALLLSERLGLPLTDHLTLVGADWQPEYLPRLDLPEGQMALEPFVEPAEVVILDNRSSLFDPEGEKDATAWQPAGDWLLRLRKRGKAVLLAHHANRTGGARGHSKAEDPLDLILKLTHPDDYEATHGARFVIEFVKGRGIYGPPAASFLATLTPKGWIVDDPKMHVAESACSGTEGITGTVRYMLGGRSETRGRAATTITCSRSRGRPSTSGDGGSTSARPRGSPHDRRQAGGRRVKGV